MHFQILISLSILAVLSPSIALPYHSSKSTGHGSHSNVNDHDSLQVVEGRRVDHAGLYVHSVLDNGDRTPYPRDVFDAEELHARSVVRELQRRANPVNPKLYHSKEPKPKLTAEQAKQRKDAVRQKVTDNQQTNAAKRTKALDHNASIQNPPGSARKWKAGSRPMEVPRVPRPDMAKGTPRSDKATQKQQEANDRRKARSSKFTDARNAYKKTENLPGRNDKFSTVKGDFTGKDARTAAFNAHQFKNHPVNFQPKTFENKEQGPANNRHFPLPNMNGQGTEFPMEAGKKGGYQGGPPSAARVVLQANAKGGHDFKGVVAHQQSGGPGNMDHTQIHPAAPAVHDGLEGGLF